MEPSWGNVLDEIPLSTVEYIVAHKGLFQRAPLPDIEKPMEYPELWRAVLDRALLDYIKGPLEVGKRNFADVSAWLYDVPVTCSSGSVKPTGDFGTVCTYAIMDEETVAHVFYQCRYQGDAK